MPFTRQWLRKTRSTTDPDRTDYAENDVDRAQLEKYLGNLLRLAHASPKDISFRLERRGYFKTLDYLSKTAFPEAKITRIGNFGEIISGAVLKVLHGHALPIQRLRDNVVSDLPMHGVDLLSFGFSKDPNSRFLAVSEVKTRTTRDYNAASIGKSQLAKANVGKAIEFILSRLVREDKYRLAERVEWFVESYGRSYRREDHLFLVYDSEKWRETVYQRGTVHSHVSGIHVMRIRNLRELICRSYERGADNV